MIEDILNKIDKKTIRQFAEDIVEAVNMCDDNYSAIEEVEELLKILVADNKHGAI